MAAWIEEGKIPKQKPAGWQSAAQADFEALEKYSEYFSLVNYLKSKRIYPAICKGVALFQVPETYRPVRFYNN